MLSSRRPPISQARCRADTAAIFPLGRYARSPHDAGVPATSPPQAVPECSALTVKLRPCVPATPALGRDDVERDVDDGTAARSASARPARCAGRAATAAHASSIVADIEVGELVGASCPPWMPEKAADEAVAIHRVEREPVDVDAERADALTTSAITAPIGNHLRRPAGVRLATLFPEGGC